MKAFVIYHEERLSRDAAKECLNSSTEVGNDFEIKIFRGFTQYDEIQSLLNKHGLKWTYPWYDEKIDFNTGLKLTPYPTKNQLARVGCYCSHFALWEKCSKSEEPFLILEHDAFFLRAIDFEKHIDPKEKSVIGINSPWGATRKQPQFHAEVEKSNHFFLPVPRIDDVHVPQGLAGNSAYIITPPAAQEVIRKARDVGAWPNDAFLCYQLFPFLLVTNVYYTRVQGLRSTTSN